MTLTVKLYLCFLSFDMVHSGNSSSQQQHTAQHFDNMLYCLQNLTKWMLTAALMVRQREVSKLIVKYMIGFSLTSDCFRSR